MKMERIAIIEGLRSPIAKASGRFKRLQADELAGMVLRELVLRTDIPFEMFDEVVVGNVAGPPHASNVARVIAIRAGFDKSIPAVTVNRNCASGMEAITASANRLRLKERSIICAGGVESMSNIPIFHNDKMRDFIFQFGSSRTFMQKLSTLSQFRLDYLKPVIGLMSGLTDPISGLIMGNTAEVLAKEFGIDRETQDAYAVQSHQRAEMAIDNKLFSSEILPIVHDTRHGGVLENDDGIRKGQNMKALGKLRPFFDRKYGTVTAGNSSQVSDGAAGVVLMLESRAKEMGLTPLGYLKDHVYVGLEAARMGLGPVFATAKLMEQAKMDMKDIELVELNEAFAVQVLANMRAFESDDFAKKELGRSKALGALDMDLLNVNGGAVAIGHPVGMSGMRLVIHLLKEMRRRSLQTGLATLCVGGGQGAALLLEVD